jgi:hypothetical protein
VRTVHLHGGNRGCRSGPDRSFPRAAEENNDDDGPGCNVALLRAPDESSCMTGVDLVADAGMKVW